MTPTKTATLLGCFAAGALLSPLFNRLLESLGAPLPGLPWIAVLGLLVLSAVLLILGWPIKKWAAGDRSKELDLIQAARVLVMAKAASVTGALLTGWYLGTAGFLLAGIRPADGWSMLIAVGAAAILTGVGLLVEWFCQLPPDDRGESQA